MADYLITNSFTQSLFGLGLTRTTLEKALPKFNVNILGCDTETTGLKFWEDKLLMLQIYNGEDNFIIDCQNVDLSPLAPIFANDKITKIFHNAKFDVKFLKANGLPCENVYDTMLVDKLIHCGKRSLRHSLAALMNRYFGTEMEKATRSTFINHKGDFTKAQLQYGLDDTVKLIEIKKLQTEQVENLELEKVVQLENKAVLAFADLEYNGLFLDKNAWDKNAKIVKAEMDSLLNELDSIVAEEHPEYKERQYDMFDGGREATINWDSPTQVLKLMHKYDKTLESAGGPALKPLAKSEPLIKAYVEYKEKAKLYNSYGPDFYKYVGSDGKVHTSFDQILETGRVSSRGPNMQQIPAVETYRNAFIPEDKDWVFVSSDFSAQELCIIAYGSKDPVWLQVLRDGGDLHGTCAELIFGEKWLSLGSTNEERKNTPEGKKLRTHVKTLNFGLAYGMGVYSLSAQLDISEDDAQDLVDKYYAAFPRIKGFLESIGKYGKDNGHIRTYKPFRRIRHFENWNGSKTDKKDMAKIERASKNTPIQGSGADMTKLALIMVRDMLKTYPHAKMVLTVHDEINCIAHKDHAEEFAQMLKSTMEKAATYIVGKGLLKSDPVISRAWSK